MQRTRLKELITQLEDLLTELKVEVYADADAYIAVSYTHLTLPTT